MSRQSLPPPPRRERRRRQPARAGKIAPRERRANPLTRGGLPRRPTPRNRPQPCPRLRRARSLAPCQRQSWACSRLRWPSTCPSARPSRRRGRIPLRRGFQTPRGALGSFMLAVPLCPLRWRGPGPLPPLARELLRLWIGRSSTVPALSPAPKHKGRSRPVPARPEGRKPNWRRRTAGPVQMPESMIPCRLPAICPVRRTPRRESAPGLRLPSLGLSRLRQLRPSRVRWRHRRRARAPRRLQVPLRAPRRTRTRTRMRVWIVAADLASARLRRHGPGRVNRRSQLRPAAEPRRRPRRRLRRDLPPCCLRPAVFSSRQAGRPWRRQRRNRRSQD